MLISSPMVYQIQRAISRLCCGPDFGEAVGI
jgi:hypothetical protein